MLKTVQLCMKKDSNIFLFSNMFLSSNNSMYCTRGLIRTTNDEILYLNRRIKPLLSEKMENLVNILEIEVNFSPFVEFLIPSLQLSK